MTLVEDITQVIGHVTCIQKSCDTTCNQCHISPFLSQRDMQELNERLEDDLRDKEYELGRMEQELEELQKALEATAAPPPPVVTHSTACQTTEPLAAQVKYCLYCETILGG